ncbi:MAG TPA: alpha/beta fold hydrolase [Phycisphaerales bacterium]|nr:alpha/beta fold hydrolase [Phycisphaerales bacterium]
MSGHPANTDSITKAQKPSELKRLSVRYFLPLIMVAIFFKLTGCAERLFYHPEAGRSDFSRRFKGAEEVTFASADGTKLNGWFIAAQVHGPASAASDTDVKYPTIIHVHGNAGNISGHIGFTDYLPAAGFNLFVFDYRGYGASEGSAWRRADLIADTLAAIDCVLARPDVDPQRVALYGQSLGGAIAIDAMAKRPQIRCAIFESAFASWRQVAASAVGGAEPGAFSKSLAWLLISDADRPLDAIKMIHRPMLILHGTADTIVPVQHGRMLRDASEGYATLIEYPGGQHNSLRDSHPQVEKDVITFLNQHLD